MVKMNRGILIKYHLSSSLRIQNHNLSLSDLKLIVMLYQATGKKLSRKREERLKSTIKFECFLRQTKNIHENYSQGGRESTSNIVDILITYYLQV